MIFIYIAFIALLLTPAAVLVDFLIEMNRKEDEEDKPKTR